MAEQYDRILNLQRGVPLDTPIQNDDFDWRCNYEDDPADDDNWYPDFPDYPLIRDLGAGITLRITNQHAEPHPASITLQFNGAHLISFCHDRVFAFGRQFDYDWNELTGDRRWPASDGIPYPTQNTEPVHQMVRKIEAALRSSDDPTLDAARADAAEVLRVWNLKPLEPQP